MATGGAAMQGAQGLDGVWGGARDALAAQVIVTGGAVIGFFWRDDYLKTKDTKASADGLGLSFAFEGGQARLTRTGDRTATIEVRQDGNLVRLDLRRD